MFFSLVNKIITEVDTYIKVDGMKNRAKRVVPFVLAMMVFAMLVGLTEIAEASPDS